MCLGYRCKSFAVSVFAARCTRPPCAMLPPLCTVALNECMVSHVFHVGCWVEAQARSQRCGLTCR